MTFDAWTQISATDLYPTTSLQTNTPDAPGHKVALFSPTPALQNVYLSASDANNLADAIVALSSGTVYLTGALEALSSSEAAARVALSSALSSTIGAVSSAFSATIGSVSSAFSATIGAVSSAFSATIESLSGAFYSLSGNLDSSGSRWDVISSSFMELSGNLDASASSWNQAYDDTTRVFTSGTSAPNSIYMTDIGTGLTVRLRVINGVLSIGAA